MWCDVWCLCVHTLPFVELGLSTFEHLEFHHLDLWTKNFLEEFLTCLSFAYAAFRYYHNSKSPVNESLAVLLHILADLQSFVWFTGFLSCQGWAAYIVSLVLISLYYRPELAKKYKTSLYGRYFIEHFKNLDAGGLHLSPAFKKFPSNLFNSIVRYEGCWKRKLYMLLCCIENDI